MNRTVSLVADSESHVSFPSAESIKSQGSEQEDHAVTFAGTTINELVGSIDADVLLRDGGSKVIDPAQSNHQKAFQADFDDYFGIRATGPSATLNQMALSQTSRSHASAYECGSGNEGKQIADAVRAHREPPWALTTTREQNIDLNTTQDMLKEMLIKSGEPIRLPTRGHDQSSPTAASTPSSSVRAYTAGVDFGWKTTLKNRPWCETFGTGSTMDVSYNTFMTTLSSTKAKSGRDVSHDISTTSENSCSDRVVPRVRPGSQTPSESWATGSTHGSQCSDWPRSSALGEVPFKPLATRTAPGDAISSESYVSSQSEMSATLARAGVDIPKYSSRALDLSQHVDGNFAKHSTDPWSSVDTHSSIQDDVAPPGSIDARTGVDMPKVALRTLGSCPDVDDNFVKHATDSFTWLNPMLSERPTSSVHTHSSMEADVVQPSSLNARTGVDIPNDAPRTLDLDAKVDDDVAKHATDSVTWLHPMLSERPASSVHTHSSIEADMVQPISIDVRTDVDISKYASRAPDLCLNSEDNFAKHATESVSWLHPMLSERPGSSVHAHSSIEVDVVQPSSIDARTCVDIPSGAPVALDSYPNVDDSFAKHATDRVTWLNPMLSKQPASSVETHSSVEADVVLASSIDARTGIDMPTSDLRAPDLCGYADDNFAKHATDSVTWLHPLLSERPASSVHTHSSIEADVVVQPSQIDAQIGVGILKRSPRLAASYLNVEGNEANRATDCLTWTHPMPFEGPWSSVDTYPSIEADVLQPSSIDARTSVDIPILSERPASSVHPQPSIEADVVQPSVDTPNDARRTPDAHREVEDILAKHATRLQWQLLCTRVQMHQQEDATDAVTWSDPMLSERFASSVHPQPSIEADVVQLSSIDARTGVDIPTSAPGTPILKVEDDAAKSETPSGRQEPSVDMHSSIEENVVLPQTFSIDARTKSVVTQGNSSNSAELLMHEGAYDLRDGTGEDFSERSVADVVQPISIDAQTGFDVSKYALGSLDVYFKVEDTSAKHATDNVTVSERPASSEDMHSSIEADAVLPLVFSIGARAKSVVAQGSSPSSEDQLVHEAACDLRDGTGEVVSEIAAADMQPSSLDAQTGVDIPKYVPRTLDVHIKDEDHFAKRTSDSVPVSERPASSVGMHSSIEADVVLPLIFSIDARTKSVVTQGSSSEEQLVHEGAYDLQHGTGEVVSEQDLAAVVQPSSIDAQTGVDIPKHTPARPASSVHAHSSIEADVVLPLIFSIDARTKRVVTQATSSNSEDQLVPEAACDLRDGTQEVFSEQAVSQVRSVCSSGRGESVPTFASVRTDASLEDRLVRTVASEIDLDTNFGTRLDCQDKSSDDCSFGDSALHPIRNGGTTNEHMSRVDEFSAVTDPMSSAAESFVPVHLIDTHSKLAVENVIASSMSAPTSSKHGTSDGNQIPECVLDADAHIFVGSLFQNCEPSQTSALLSSRTNDTVPSELCAFAVPSQSASLVSGSLGALDWQRTNERGPVDSNLGSISSTPRSIARGTDSSHNGHHVVHALVDEALINVEHTSRHSTAFTSSSSQRTTESLDDATLEEARFVVSSPPPTSRSCKLVTPVSETAPNGTDAVDACTFGLVAHLFDSTITCAQVEACRSGVPSSSESCTIVTPASQDTIGWNAVDSCAFRFACELVDSALPNPSTDVTQDPAAKHEELRPSPPSQHVPEELLSMASCGNDSSPPSSRDLSSCVDKAVANILDLDFAAIDDFDQASEMTLSTGRATPPPLPTKRDGEWNFKDSFAQEKDKASSPLPAVMPEARQSGYESVEEPPPPALFKEKPLALFKEQPLASFKQQRPPAQFKEPPGVRESDSAEKVSVKDPSAKDVTCQAAKEWANSDSEVAAQTPSDADFEAACWKRLGSFGPDIWSPNSKTMARSRLRLYNDLNNAFCTRRFPLEAGIGVPKSRQLPKLAHQAPSVPQSTFHSSGGYTSGSCKKVARRQQSRGAVKKRSLSPVAEVPALEDFPWMQRGDHNARLQRPQSASACERDTGNMNSCGADVPNAKETRASSTPLLPPVRSRAPASSASTRLPSGGSSPSPPSSLSRRGSRSPVQRTIQPPCPITQRNSQSPVLSGRPARSQKSLPGQELLDSLRKMAFPQELTCA